ncbi:hypothetical protein MMC07_006300 [Pseudocyphellaria aurata]|nr:hypothetical protein [Pseudocyphellaria aurata]
MNSLISAVWPYTTDGISYQPASSIKVLRVYTDNGGSPQLDLVEQSRQDLTRPSAATRRYHLQLVIIPHFWQKGSCHTKTAEYNISQKDLHSILTYQGLADFYCQTRADVAGMFHTSLSTGHQDGDYLGLIYDSNLGLWARYDNELEKWLGIFMLPKIKLDIRNVAEELLHFAPSRMFLPLFTARFTVDALSFKSGQLHDQAAEIERHSGHHSAVLQPLPATYAQLKRLSADATATANLVSYQKVVISPLIDELLQYLEQGCDLDDSLCTDLQRHIANLRQRLKSLTIYFTYLERRAERQVAATMHLVNEANASTNLAVAHDTKDIAVASHHDSSSMKMLAAVTTAFLPGAFVAALFSMNMFDWFASGGAPVVSGRFWVYWSVTLPLTFITVGLWVYWEHWAVSKQQRQRRSLIMESAGVDKLVSV